MAKRGRPRHPDILTPREWDVLALVREGLTNEQIAGRLEITERTARFHVSEILRKLGVSSRHEAAAWTPEERRPWWSFAFAPLSFGKAHRWLATAAASATIAVGVAGVALLVWGIARTDGEGTFASAVAPTPTVEVAPAQGLRWSAEDGNVGIEATEAGSCGDLATALKYGVPQRLVAASFEGLTTLGLEAEPYEYQSSQVFQTTWPLEPYGWRLYRPNEPYWYMFSKPMLAVTDYYLRRLDMPSLLFHYSVDLCEPPSDPLIPRPFVLPNAEPHVVIHRQGDYLSADEAMSQVLATAPNEVSVVWAELGLAEDFLIEHAGAAFPLIPPDPNRVVWILLLRVGDLWGPRRTGEEYAVARRIDATTRESMGWSCCYQLITDEAP